jgi:hypothetical protein
MLRYDGHTGAVKSVVTAGGDVRPPEFPFAVGGEVSGAFWDPA